MEADRLPVSVWLIHFGIKTSDAAQKSCWICNISKWKIIHPDDLQQKAFYNRSVN